MSETETNKDEKPEKHSTKHLEAYKWKKGVSGNPNGRPKGPTLKEWVRQRLLEMDDDERADFLKTVPREVIWRMAEGMPKQETEVSGELVSKVINVDE